jgi:hypothetical protein
MSGSFHEHRFFQLLIGLQFQSIHKISNLGLVWFGFVLGLGFTKFYTQPSIVHYVLFCCLIQPDRYSVATAVVTTGSNWAVGIFMGYRRMKSRPSTMSFCLMMSYGSPVRRVTHGLRRQVTEKSLATHATRLFPLTGLLLLVP